jgi:hypothetical protein
MKNLLLTILVLFCAACYQGPVGPQGAQGVGCTTQTIQPSTPAPNGGALITCGSTQSLILNGAPGSNGAPGTPGTIVAPVQFCTGAVSSYPSTFPEVGFCINNEIYAVYSANDGFLTGIPNGNYYSNAIGSTCNFSVSNCSVTDY